MGFFNRKERKERKANSRRRRCFAIHAFFAVKF